MPHYKINTKNAKKSDGGLTKTHLSKFQKPAKPQQDFNG
jgi:hypothetical protein